MKLSVIIPVYNEVESIREIVKRVQDTKLAWEIVLVDDGSIDGTRDVLKEMDGKDKVRVILKDKNEGKGSAVRVGLTSAKGDVLLIQDADLEYDPRDYPALLKPLEEGVRRYVDLGESPSHSFSSPIEALLSPPSRPEDWRSALLS